MNLLSKRKPYALKYFKIEEFHCKCSFTDCTKLPDGGMDRKLLKSCDKLREQFGFPITVTSGYRCPDWNDKVGGVPKTDKSMGSQHMYGTAADLRPSAYSDKRLQLLYSKAVKLNPKGLGEYSTFVHIDQRRGDRARWKGK
jgi:uncharacterized protein YcbK (DUF882 family)